MLLSSLTSEMKQIVPFFVRIMELGASHLKLFLHIHTSMFINLLTFVFRVSHILGIGNGLAWYDFAPSKSSIFILILYNYLVCY